MSTESLIIDTSKEAVEPSLEEQALAAGIDVKGVDPEAPAQTAKEPSQKILGKFESQEALIEAYKQLEKKLGASSNDKEGATQEERIEPEADDKIEENKKELPTSEEVAKAATEKAGLDLNELSQKYWTNGEKLEDGDYEKLEKAGFPKGLVEQFIEGEKAKQTLTRNTVFNSVGGEDSYKSMVAWAKTSYSADEVRAYDEAVNSGDNAKVMNAVKGLKARFEVENGSEPSRTIEARSGRSEGSRYESVAQLMADMRNPKYNSDPSYRRGVEQKLSRSDIM